MKIRSQEMLKIVFNVFPNASRPTSTKWNISDVSRLSWKKVSLFEEVVWQQWPSSSTEISFGRLILICHHENILILYKLSWPMNREHGVGCVKRKLLCHLVSGFDMICDICRLTFSYFVWSDPKAPENLPDCQWKHFPGSGVPLI